MKLFLATFKLEHHRYMNGTKRDTNTSMRLVWANHADEAYDKLIAAVEIHGGHGGDHITAFDIDVTEAIS